MSKARALVVDIETAGCDFETLDETSKEYLLKYAENEEKELEIKESLSFYPLTAQVVAIGMAEADSNKSFVFYQSSQKKEPVKEEETVTEEPVQQKEDAVETETEESAEEETVQ